jgi:hypothetical protein
MHQELGSDKESRRAIVSRKELAKLIDQQIEAQRAVLIAREIILHQTVPLRQVDLLKLRLKAAMRKEGRS